eukprot:Skav222397  [mRNA]  locus=scaffold4422:233805:265450:+ [translate_table: standard]
MREVDAVWLSETGAVPADSEASATQEGKQRVEQKAFTEPARFYWARTSGRPGCPKWLEENVEAHALNWYVAMLGSYWAAKAEKPQLPAESAAPAAASQAATEEAETKTEAPADWAALNAKLPYEKTPEQKKLGMLAEVSAAMEKILEEDYVEKVEFRLLLQYTREYFELYQLYIGINSEKVFVRRCFEALNAEQRPELVGASNAMKELFKEYRRELDLSEDSLVEHCYKARHSTAEDLWIQLGPTDVRRD